MNLITYIENCKPNRGPLGRRASACARVVEGLIPQGRAFSALLRGSGYRASPVQRKRGDQRPSGGS